MRISFDLTSRDLAFFRREMSRTRKSLRLAEDAEIIGAAREALALARSADAPEFVKERLERLEPLAAMLEDPDWVTPAAERRQALAVLAYFGDPEDLIPDHLAGIGYLDDAIVIELACRELRHELEGFLDFGRYRDGLATDFDGTRLERRLDTRRTQLRARVKRRKNKDRGRDQL